MQYQLLKFYKHNPNLNGFPYHIETINCYVTTSIDVIQQQNSLLLKYHCFVHTRFVPNVNKQVYYMNQCFKLKLFKRINTKISMYCERLFNNLEIFIVFLLKA
ncbi:hypothetical protein KSF78_0006255 [Schistosoma japonicum]|nr:hypothetical protein KSF78_0006255 [Schistosoma japonicum]